MENPGSELANFQALQTLRPAVFSDILQNNATFYSTTMQKAISKKGFETDLRFFKLTVSLS